MNAKVYQASYVFDNYHSPEFIFSNMTDPGDLISRFDPGEMFADDFIDGEFSEVRHGNKKWEIVIKVFLIYPKVLMV